VDRVADELGASSDRVVRQHGERNIPIVGVRKPDQLKEARGSLEVELSADHRAA
jgi:aryl-alcohol dehydrogenase-like predicted oxidoreductase